MGRFGSQKIFNAVDKAMQTVFNKLCDLLDTGYSIESIIGGKNVKIDIDTKTGIGISVDNVKVLGLDSEGRAYINRIADPDNMRNYIEMATIGLFAGLEFFAGFANTIPRSRLKIMSAGITKGTIAATVYDGTGNTGEGVSIFTIEHGDAELFLGDTNTWGKASISLASKSMGINYSGYFINSLPIYADNAAALLGGLTANNLYRTGADPDVVCVVH